MAEMKSA